MNFGKMGNMANMLKQAQQLQKQMAAAQEELAKEQVEGTSGGGMVTATVNGHGDLLSIKINPDAVDKEDMELLEDLIVAAVGEASRKAKEMMSSRLNSLTGGMGLPF